MTVLAIDLALKYSAACVMADDGTVKDEWDSAASSTETGWVNSIASTFFLQDPRPQVLIIEDLPHRLPHSTLTKAVARLQGRIYDSMVRIGYGDKVLFLAPQAWRSHYPALAKYKSGPDAVVGVAAGLGYSPPDLSHLVGARGGKALALKVATDYCAAFLMGRWALHQKKTWDSYDVPGTARYGQQQKRKEKGGQ